MPARTGGRIAGRASYLRGCFGPFQQSLVTSLDGAAPPLDLHSVFFFFFLSLRCGLCRRVLAKLLPKLSGRKAATCFCRANLSLPFDVFIPMRKMPPTSFFFPKEKNGSM